VEREERRRSLADTFAVVPALAAFCWAVDEVLVALWVITADEFPQCSSLHPDKALLALVTLVVAGFAGASLGLVVRGRTLLAYGCALAQIPLFFAWSALDGGAASCLIG
jgi:hypothetical protein